MRNFFVDFRGGATSRPGTEFVGQAKVSSNVVRLVPFQFSTQQTYVLEFGNEYIRFITNGAYVLENAINITSASISTSCTIGVTTCSYSTGDWIQVPTGPVGMVRLSGSNGLTGRTFIVGSTTSTSFQIIDPITGNNIDSSTWTPWVSGGTVARIYTKTSPWSGSDLQYNPTTNNPGLKFTQSADVLTITHPSYPIYDVNRLGQTNWTIVARGFAPVIQAPTFSTASASVSGTTYYQYKITALSPSGAEESLGSNIGTSPGSAIMSQNGLATITLSWVGVASASSYNIYRAPEVPNGTPPPGSLFGLIGTTVGTSFTDANLTPDFSTVVPTLNNPFANGQIQTYNIVSSGSNYSSTSTAGVTGNGTGATLILTVNNGNITGALPQQTGINYTTASISVYDTFGSGSGASITPNIVNPDNYPGSTGYFQERQTFAASNPDPETLWMTQPGNFNNMDYSTPSRPDDSIEVALTGTSIGGGMQVNAIKAMVPMPLGLVVFTGGAVFQLTGGQSPSPPVTPANIAAQPMVFVGSSDVAPITINNDILFVPVLGNSVRDILYNYYASIFTGLTATDISLLSAHLFIDQTIIEWSYADSPYKIVWAVRSDGTLLSLTYLKEQDLAGWARHDTQGQFLSVTSVVEGQDNAVYFVVQRLINGNLVKYVERMASRDFYNDVSLAWCLDSALQNTFTSPAATLSVQSINGNQNYYQQYERQQLQSLIIPGDIVAFTASVGVFSAASTGSTLRFNNGNILINTASTSYNVSGVVINPPQNLTPASSGSWSLTAPISFVSGLDHLEGQTVGILADGNVLSTASVYEGCLTLTQSAATITIGLQYTGQLQTLPLEVGSVTETIQGKFVKGSYLTARVYNTRGLKAGMTFDTVTPIRVPPPALWGQAPPLHTGDLPRFVMDPLWATPFQYCFQLDDPVPAQLLAAIPEIVLGSSPG